MTSIQLPPLDFDGGGGFRVSIITGPAPARATSASSAKHASGPEPEGKAQPDPEPERRPESKDDRERDRDREPEQAPESKLDPKQEEEPPPPPEPRRPPPPQPGPLQTLAATRYNADNGVGSQAEPGPTPEPLRTLAAVPSRKPVPAPAPAPEPVAAPEPKASTPAPEAEPPPVPMPRAAPPQAPKPAIEPRTEPEPALETYTAPASERESADIPTCLPIGHELEMEIRQPQEPPPTVPEIPSHPIESMQRAFSESLEEVTNGGTEKPRLRDLDAAARRERLLAQDKDDLPFDAVWRYRPGQKQHEVLKLISQITFGVYLLLNGMANDNAQVINILQGHIDEVDEFLEVTLEDFAQASSDLSERIDYLKLPMSNMKVFEEMLEDRNYRAEILEGNEKIDQVLARMNVVLKQWDDDIDAGLEGSAAFQKWLYTVRDGPWRYEQPELTEIFVAMEGNAEGWLNAFNEMNAKTQAISNLMVNLVTIVAEMEKAAGEISRKTWVSYGSNNNDNDNDNNFARTIANSAQSSIPPFTSPKSDSSKSGRDNLSISSPPSVSSNPRSTTRASVRSGSIASGRQPVQLDDELFLNDGLDEFPLPGAAPLLPPTRSSARMTKWPPVTESPKLHVDTAPKPAPAVEATPEEEREDSPMYLLQPRTYTPQPPEPLPSPLVRDASASPSGSSRTRRQSTEFSPPILAPTTYERVPSPKVVPLTVDSKPVSERSATPRSDAPTPVDVLSIHDRSATPRSGVPTPVDMQPIHGRVSSPRGDIRVSTNNARTGPGRASPVISTAAIPASARGASNGLKLSIRESSGSGLQIRDSYGSELEAIRQHRMPRSGSHAELRTGRPSLMQSPSSDYQHYHPVLASPHSPLQQRPHTAGGPQSHRPSGYFTSQSRNQPSRLGSMATLSTVGSGSNDNRTVRPKAPSMAGAQTLKKKKSAFGWLKKAFTMDEEERAAFEARKAMPQPDNYYKGKDPKFLDGKRIR